jgi:hypothetical protein
MFKSNDSDTPKQNVNNFDKYNSYYFQYENKIKLSNTSDNDKYTNVIKQQYQNDTKSIVITK